MNDPHDRDELVRLALIHGVSADQSTAQLRRELAEIDVEIER